MQLCIEHRSSYLIMFPEHADDIINVGEELCEACQREDQESVK